jgi:excisionase family DNA binding protein
LSFLPVLPAVTSHRRKGDTDKCRQVLAGMPSINNMEKHITLDMAEEYPNLTYSIKAGELLEMFRYVAYEILEEQRREQNHEQQDSWLDLKEFIAYHPDHPATPTVYEWVSKRLVPHHKSGKKLRFRKSEIDQWLSEGKRQSADEIEAAATQYLTVKKKGGML